MQGTCDRSAGTCTCQIGYSGDNCQQLECSPVTDPAATSTDSTAKCNSQGTCDSIATWATEAQDSDGSPASYTYGQSSTAATWDKDSIYGCRCTRDYYRGPFSDEKSDVTGVDCTQYFCPVGDDQRTTGQYHETQTIKCIADGGTFTVTFRESTSNAIAYNANQATIQSTLNSMTSVSRTLFGGQFTVGVSVALTEVSNGNTASAACSSSGTYIALTFTVDLGDIPMATVSSSLTLTASSATLVVAETTKGTMENAECSNSGLCDFETGQCRCHEGYTSSDGAGNLGVRGDCGYFTPWQGVEGYPVAASTTTS